MPTIYAYNLPIPAPVAGATPSSSGPTRAIMRIGTDSSLSTEAPLKQGRLFQVQLGLSPNMAILSSTSSTTAKAQPQASDLPAASGSYGEAVLAVQAKIYTVAQPGVSPAPGAFPVLTFDAAVAR